MYIYIYTYVYIYIYVLMYIHTFVFPVIQSKRKQFNISIHECIPINTSAYRLVIRLWRIPMLRCVQQFTDSNFGSDTNAASQYLRVMTVINDILGYIYIHICIYIYIYIDQSDLFTILGYVLDIPLQCIPICMPICSQLMYWTSARRPCGICPFSVAFPI